MHASAVAPQKTCIVDHNATNERRRKLLLKLMCHTILLIDVPLYTTRDKLIAEGLRSASVEATQTEHQAALSGLQPSVASGIGNCTTAPVVQSQLLDNVGQERGIASAAKVAVIAGCQGLRITLSQLLGNACLVNVQCQQHRMFSRIRPNQALQPCCACTPQANYKGKATCERRA